MKLTKTERVQQTIIIIFTLAVVIFLVFYGYLPDSYSYKVGSISETDIYASRNFTDTYQTEYEAKFAENTVSPIFVRSDSLSQQNSDNIGLYFDMLQEQRSQKLDEFGTRVSDEEYNQLVSVIMNRSLNDYGLELNETDARKLLAMSNSVFSYIRNTTTSMTELIMMDNVNQEALPSAIDAQIDSFNLSSGEYTIYSDIIRNILSSILVPNSSFDSESTEEAAQAAYTNAINDPVIVEQGTKIVGNGEVITEHSYSQLVDLELIRDDVFDLVIFSRVALYEIVIFIVLLSYSKVSQIHRKMSMRLFYVSVLTFLIPLIAAVYLNEYISFCTIGLFVTVFAATYFGSSSGIMLSLINLLTVWPVYDFSSKMFLVSFAAIVVCSTIAGNKKKANNSASVILFTTLTAAATAAVIDFMNAATRDNYINDLIVSTVVTLAAVVFAIGLMPVFELISKQVSPIKLIDLSQPNQPLLKRLFLEAPGTSQHSTMVSNLADAAAEAIGADALLCKVASYYHDIGKLNNPKYFTENLEHDEMNPHDMLTWQESVAIITGHTEDGVKLAKKAKLPSAIIDIINEHHGTTCPKFFYHKACKEAEEQGLPKPDIEEFKYRGNIPQTRESAVVMIADTCEAAIRSKKIDNVSDAEATMRVLIKDKIDNDQLNHSGLSFDDIEKIIEAFKQIYAGSFHERIKYPE